MGKKAVMDRQIRGYPPFANEDEFREEAKKFIEKVRVAREEHGITDVFVIAQGYSKSDEGLCETLLTQHFGMGNALVMLASTLGTWRARFDEHLNRLRNPGGR